MSMKKKKNRKNIVFTEELSPRGKENKNTRIFWMICLTVLMTTGVRMIVGEMWGTLDPSWIAFLLAVVVTMAICTGAEVYRKKFSWSGFLMLIPYPLLLLIAGAPNIWNGAKVWINVLITRWNTIHEGGVALFSVKATEGAISGFTLFLMVAVTEILWLLVTGRHMILGNLFLLFWVMIQLICGALNPLGCGLLLVGLAGLWITDRKLPVSLRQVLWTGGILAIVAVMVWVLPEKEFLSIREIREAVSQEIHRLRYGEDTLPEGDLYQADKLKSDGQEMLKVSSQQQKTLYLKGYTGSIYKDGIWLPPSDAVYGGDQSGMLKWLSKNGFDPLKQVSEYYNLGEEDQIPEENKINVQVTGASRYYVYAPSSLENIIKGKVSEKKDTGFTGTGFFGTENYELQEISGSRPAELTVADAWVSSPENKEQEQYIQAEAVYRSFVYDNYRTVDADTAELVRTLFWDDYESESDGIYSAVSHVRDVLKNVVEYTDYPEEVSDGEDPVRWFLTESGRGNAMYYASAAVDALRVHGIPARYAEGYYISSSEAEESNGKDISVTGNDTHAWAEVYFDGVGWLPIDVTPGYYFDAVSLQKMVSTPDVVQKNAAFQDNSFGAEEVTGLDGESSRSKRDRLLPVVRNVGAICLGLLAVVIILLVLILVVSEFTRGYCIWHTEKTYKNATHRERIQRIEKAIYSWMSLAGIEAHLGWNTKETDKVLSEHFPEVEEGEYIRVSELLEKVIYGGMELEPFEVRTLISFFTKLTEIGRTGNLRYRLILRYAFAWKNRR